MLIAFALLYATSTPLVAGALVRSLQTVPAIESPAAIEGAGAIVVLGSGAYRNAPEYGEASLGGSALERLRYGVWLHRRTGLPLLVTGGSPAGAEPPEARVMARVLREDYRIEPRWIEDRARNTRESAALVRELLAGEGIGRIVLVTHAIHMPRAKRAFEKAGFEVVPAPTKFAAPGGVSALDFLPSGSAMAGLRGALHEWLGRLWYEIRG